MLCFLHLDDHSFWSYDVPSRKGTLQWDQLSRQVLEYVETFYIFMRHNEPWFCIRMSYPGPLWLLTMHQTLLTVSTEILSCGVYGPPCSWKATSKNVSVMIGGAAIIPTATENGTFWALFSLVWKLNLPKKQLSIEATRRWSKWGPHFLSVRNCVLLQVWKCFHI